MTISGDFIQDSEFDAPPSYPTAFGIPLTPTVKGIIFALLGIAGGAALLVYLVQPAWERNRELQARVDEKTAQLQELDSIKQQIKQAQTRLTQVNQQRTQVLSLFATERTMDTLLLDVNQLIEKNNEGLVAATRAKLDNCPAWVRNQYSDILKYQTFEQQVGPMVARAKLSKFQPDPKVSGVITDSSLGAPINNKLKRQVMNVEVQGNFNQTQSVFRTIERLQPLLLIKNLNVQLGNANRSNTKGLYELGSNGTVRFLTNCQPDAVITTSFQMEALLPLTEEDKKALAPSPSPAAQ